MLLGSVHDGAHALLHGKALLPGALDAGEGKRALLSPRMIRTEEWNCKNTRTCRFGPTGGQVEPATNRMV